MLLARSEFLSEIWKKIGATHKEVYAFDDISVFAFFEVEIEFEAGFTLEFDTGFGGSGIFRTQSVSVYGKGHVNTRHLGRP